MRPLQRERTISHADGTEVLHARKKVNEDAAEHDSFLGDRNLEFDERTGSRSHAFGCIELRLSCKTLLKGQSIPDTLASASLGTVHLPA